MQKTPNYQLNQWDGEDRIMRTDFNSDNAKIDTALQQGVTALADAKSALESALEAERQARAEGDSSASQATASAKQELLNAISAEQTARTSGDTAVRGEFAAADSAIRKDFAAADTAIRKDFAAADSALSAASPLVYLKNITTSQAATQVDLSLQGINFSNYSALILVPKLTSSAEKILIRVNNLSDDYSYQKNGSYFNSITQFSPFGNKNNYIRCLLHLHGPIPVCETLIINSDTSTNYDHSVIRVFALSNSTSVSTINFISSDGAKISAGSRILLYGLKF